MKVIIDWKNLAEHKPEINKSLIIKIPSNSAQGIKHTLCIGRYSGPIFYNERHGFIANKISTKSFYKETALSYSIYDRLLDQCYWDYYAEEWVGHLYSNINELLDVK